VISDLKETAVVGAGTMGRGIANVLASNGHRVAIVDRDVTIAEGAKDSIRADLEVAVEEGFLPAGDLESALARITPARDLASAVGGAAFVVEAVPEDVQLKLDVWRRLDDLALEDAILATNTSSFDVNEIANVAPRHRERIVGTHWYNPAHIIPCVEVVPAETTSQQTVDTTIGLLRKLGKEPAVTRSVPGFVGNRIQLVMAAEAFRCVEQGIATAEDVDAIVRSSFGFRLGAFGPLQVSDLAGLDVYLGVYDYLTARCGDPWYEAPELLRELVREGRTGVKSLAGVYDYSSDEADRLRAERDRLLYRQLRVYRDERAASPDEPGEIRTG
jgi:3-hydroxybutyryl-CoA dehydrogenase